MVSEALTTSAIEGEQLADYDIRSSMKRILGLLQTPAVNDRRAIAISNLMISAQNTFRDPLSIMQLWDWHTMLMIANPFAQGIGQWRSGTEPMQIISGVIGKENIHFEAPPSISVAVEMEHFIAWFNDTELRLPGPIRAAIAHLYFESIHPFEDGNGRIGRVIAEKALSQAMGYPVLLSLSTIIHQHKKQYYEALSTTSRYTLDITEWIYYFVTLVCKAQEWSQAQINFVAQKTKFWAQYHDKLNERQIQIITKMLHNGPSGFEGGIQARKYMKITGCSKATATRDLTELLSYGCIIKIPDSAGRNTRYTVLLQ
jgi:Fic family protein